MLNERAMRQISPTLGLDGTELVDPRRRHRQGSAPARRRGAAHAWSSCSSKLEELVKVVQRRGIDFADFLAQRDTHGQLPLYRVIVEGEEQFFHTADERDDVPARAEARRR